MLGLKWESLRIAANGFIRGWLPSRHPTNSVKEVRVNVISHYNTILDFIIHMVEQQHNPSFNIAGISDIILPSCCEIQR